jgi:hypothetical protein
LGSAALRKPLHCSRCPQSPKRARWSGRRVCPRAATITPALSQATADLRDERGWRGDGACVRAEIPRSPNEHARRADDGQSRRLRRRDVFQIGPTPLCN